MARDELYWTQDTIDAYGQAATQAAGQAPSVRTGGVILGALVLILVMALACGAPLGIVSKKVEGDTAKAKAIEHEAEAVRVLADARAEAEVIRAEANAELLLTYNEIAHLALDSDIRRSHPELILTEIVTQLCLGTLALIACISVSAVVFVYSQDRKGAK